MNERSPPPLRQAGGEGADDSSTYRLRGHTFLPQLLHPQVAHRFLAELNTDLAQAGRPLDSFMTSGPLLRGEAAEVYGHMYRPLIALLYGLTPRIALAVGRPLLPTYSYFRVYQAGDICRVHADRPACEHSLSLTIATSDGAPWALSIGETRMTAPDRRVSEDFGAERYASLPMQPGDALLYQGVHFRHGRLDPSPNRWSAHAFLHWVDEEGPYRDQAFDAPTLLQAQRARG